MIRSESLTGGPAVAVSPATFLHDVLSLVGATYCRLFHRSISLPVDGRYHCWKCLREFDVDWR